MNLKIGIVGLPNVGKSTLFNALLKKQVADAAPYPFCTIDPNVGVVPVPDIRLTKLAQITQFEDKMEKLPPLVPAVVEFVDIAGLVKGASKGEGLGNKFLSHIREVDIICHVVREFDDPAVVHVADTIDPKRDREVIETELILADLQTLDKQVEPNRNIKDKDAEKRWEIVKKLKVELNSGKNAREVITDREELELIRDFHLLSLKPVLYVINVSENQLSDLSLLSHSSLPSHLSLAVCAKTESELASLAPEEQVEYLKSLGLESSGLDRLIQKTYSMLGLISFLTCGVKEVRAWTIYDGMTAQKASGVIHTDFEKKFIKADVVAFADFVAINGWKKAREAGKVRQEGRDYIMKDGDVVEFKIGS
jgi:ribosome-binding ATPase